MDNEDARSYNLKKSENKNKKRGKVSVYENLDRNRNENRKWKEISGQLQCSGRRTFFPIRILL